MEKLIIAVDFDGVLVEDKFPEIGKANEEAFEVLKKLNKAGHKLILNTCRTNAYKKTNRQLLDEAVDFCVKNGLIFNSINENLPEVIKKYGCDTRKISADYYIDDRNFGTHVINFKLIAKTFNV